MAREVTAATRIVIVCNPNNPTATALPPAAIDAFVAALPRHVAVILDEAYVEFSTLQDPDESLDLLDEHPNLVLLRTFSKVYGLCGLRVGLRARLARTSASRVDRVRQPFSVNALAQAAAAEALSHQDEVRAARRAHRDRAPARGDGAGRARARDAPTARRTSPGSRSATATRPRSSAGSRSAA